MDERWHDRFPRIIEHSQPGDHLCCIYETEEEHRAVLTPFLRQGLERGEKVLYIVDAHTAETILGYLRDEGVDVEACLERGQLAILTRDDAYMQEGIFDPQRMIALLRAETERALAEGYPALRVTGEMTWALRGLPGSERLIEYEARLNEFFPGSQCLAICQYDRRRFDAALLLDVLRTHPIVVFGTEVYDNFYYIPPAEFLSGDRAAVELQRWEQSMAQRRRAEEQISHLNAVLRAIRNVNQLITREKDRDRLLKGACENLIRTRGYLSAWIALLDESGGLVTAAEAGLGEDFLPLVKRLERGEMPHCAQVALEQADALVIKDTPSTCVGCSLSAGYDSKQGMSVRLEHGGKVYGLLTVSIPGDVAVEEKERVLFREVGGDIAFALHGVELQEERRRAEEALRLRMEQLMALSQASQAVTASLELDQVLAEIVSLASKVAGSDYASVALVDETGHMSQSAENLPGIPSLEYRVRDEGFTSWIVHSRQAVVVDEIGEDGAVSPDPGEGAPRTANPHLVEAGLKSFAGLPLVAKDRLLGILYLHSLRPRAFHGQLPLLTAFANQIGLAIQNARLFGETKRRAAETTALLETSLALNSLDLDSTLRTIGERAKALFAADGCRIFLLEPDGETLRCVLALHQRAEAVLAMRPKLGQGVTGDIAQRGEAEIVNDMLGDPRSVQVPGTPLEKEAMMFAPLKERERVIGVMSVSRLGDERPFRPAELELLKAFASMASSAISNARLFQEAHRRAAQLAIVNELGRSLAATLDLPTIYRTARQYVQRLVDCPNFAISRFDTEQQVLTMAFCLSDGLELDLALFPPLSYKPQARSGRSKAIASGQPVIVCDQHGAFRESDQAHRIGNGLEPLSALYVPMIVEGQPIGLLEVQSYQPQAYREEDIELLTTAANQIGLAIQNARLFGETRRLQEFNQSIVQSMTEGIAIENADGVFTFVNPAAARMLGYAPEELMGQHWTTIIPSDQQPIVRAADERRARGESDRYELELVRKDGTRISVLVSGSPRFQDGCFVGTMAVFTDISERKRAEEELRQSYLKLQRMLEGTVNALMSAIELRDPYTAGHQRRVTRLACAIAKEVGLPEERIEGLRMAGLIHDIGKITVPAEVLSKPGPLNKLEYGLIKHHPQIGHDVLKTIEFPWPVAQIVLQHHERMDGSGYPQGLSGGEIMPEARMLAVADVVEAMASHRPYRPARGIARALEEISQNRGILYDAEIVDVCLRLFTEKGFTFE